METKKYFVEELTHNQLKIINGGFEQEPGSSGWGPIGIVLAILKTVTYIVDHLDSLKDGIKDGGESADRLFSKLI
jgi:hypothetical protein